MGTIFQTPKLKDVKDLLIENKLPFEDLSDRHMEHFFGCGEGSNTKGIIGLEQHGADGLLRSLAVASEVRGLGCGSDLVETLENHARSIGINNLYLLTNTAEDYFENKGYSAVSRELVSNKIKRTKEFSELCPDSAVVMRKDISC